MASSALANFLSIFTPFKSPPQPVKAPPSHLSLSTDSSSNNKHAVTSNSSSSSSSSASNSSLPGDLMSVVCPSFAYANTLYFRSAYNVQVIVEDNEPEEKLLGRFRREVMKAGVIQECKRRRYFENKQEEKKRKHREAAKRNRRRRGPFRNFNDEKTESVNKKKDDDNDNWEMPEDSPLN
ncbi:putative ribosomal protein S21 [Helianthus annuus]|uniref:Ribosomal protein S21 n=1 Tax=Helianthus annuus TaxID=4232 RepID=A0A251SJU4_HELAN|nr:30S ribosomal protein S21, chloroplastic [Helianthus annuus]KAF5769998.1 putative ribosomal protein S21 [Helianthus annuus]KAJ0469651.1 putative ribosomal protein S21 [Helianthus annuus]KAJ0841185.1 putative ribosomal protein S21 [Helianthus annuus]KAJ0854696.1 putative ribosomal protein S21 [Helianthus annuus]